MFMQLILENLSFQNDNKELEKLVLVNRIKESKTDEEKMRTLKIMERGKIRKKKKIIRYKEEKEMNKL